MPSTAQTTLLTQETPSTSNAANNKQKAGYCWGRKFTSCTCISHKTFFIIAAAVGSLIFTLGILALAGYLAPSSGGPLVHALNQVNFATSAFAAKIGADILTIAIFGICVGGAATATGIVGVLTERHKALSA